MKTLTDGPIIYVDDDEDNLFLFEQIVKELGLLNTVRSFSDSLLFLDYLMITEEKPLLILCDLNMHAINGIELRDRIDADEVLKQKAVPFLFYTTAASPAQVQKAYQTTIQGFLVKPADLAEFKEQIQLVVSYWQNCLHPNSF